MITPMRHWVLSVLSAAVLVVPSAAGALVHVCAEMGSVALGACGCEREHDSPAAQGESHAAHHAAHREQAGHGEHAKADPASPASTAWQTESCCDSEVQPARRTDGGPSASEPTIDFSKVNLGASSIPIGVTDQLAFRDGLCRERGPPPSVGPPLFKRHCSFLN